MPNRSECTAHIVVLIAAICAAWSLTVQQGVLEMMHGMHRGVAGSIDLRETLAIDANCNEMKCRACNRM